MRDSGIQVLFKGINFERLLSGLWISLKLALVAMLFSVILGLILGILMAGKNKWIRCVSRIYLEIVRITYSYADLKIGKKIVLYKEVVMGASDESEIATDSNVQRIASASDAEKSVWVMESED